MTYMTNPARRWKTWRYWNTCGTPWIADVGTTLPFSTTNVAVLKRAGIESSTAMPAGLIQPTSARAVTSSAVSEYTSEVQVSCAENRATSERYVPTMQPAEVRAMISDASPRIVSKALLRSSTRRTCIREPCDRLVTLQSPSVEERNLRNAYARVKSSPQCSLVCSGNGIFGGRLGYECGQHGVDTAVRLEGSLERGCDGLV